MFYVIYLTQFFDASKFLESQEPNKLGGHVFNIKCEHSKYCLHLRPKLNKHLYDSHSQNSRGEEEGYPLCWLYTQIRRTDRTSI